MRGAVTAVGRWFADLPGGRRSKFAVVGVWLVVLFAIGPLAGKFEDAQENDPADYLPSNAESVEAIEVLEDFPSGDIVDAITVFNRADGPLTPEDEAAIEDVQATVNSERREGVGETGPPIPSEDGSSALLITPITVEDGTNEAGELLVDATDDIKATLDELPPGLEAKVSGPAGFSADAIDVFDSIDGALLYATAGLVLVLLIIIYRSPIFWLIPFFSVILAEVTSRGMGYLLAEAGVTVTGQSGGILPVLVFGAGTDYALLLVSRYREELRHHEDKHDAVRVAMRKAGPAIVASAATVMAALLTLTLAEVTGTSGLGPIGALGVGLAMVSMLTILPALLAITGRRAFWPFIPRYGSEGADETHGLWSRIAAWVGRGPRRVWIGTTALLLVLCLGLTELNSDLTSGNGFRDDVDSAEGQDLIEQSFPAGANAPTNVVVTDEARLDAVREAVAGAPGVAELSPEEEQGPTGTRLEATLDQDPFSTAGFDLIPGIRDAAQGAGGDAALVGGPTAEEYDLRQSAARDNRVIVPIALVLVLVILMALLRAVVAPLVLIGTVILSFGAALGIASFFFENVFDFPGMDPTLPLFAFIFLVALGIDYNIFLMARVREETITYGTRVGTMRGLAVTGTVITSAGIVLAGTFSALAVLPLVTLTEIGFTIAIGVLLDTFIVRTPSGSCARARDRRPRLVAVRARADRRQGIADQAAPVAELGLVVGSSLRESGLVDPGWRAIQRHGEGEYVLPHRIDHAANMRALADFGCERVLAVGSVGGLRSELGPGTLVCPDDFVALDAEPSTALEGPAAHRVPGFDPDWRRRVLDAFAAAGAEVGDGGVYWQARGPRLETPAEIRLAAAHADVIGMTIASECVAAGELGLRYAAVCVVDNLANGVGETALTLEQIGANRARHAERIAATLAAVVPALA